MPAGHLDRCYRRILTALSLFRPRFPLVPVLLGMLCLFLVEGSFSLPVLAEESRAEMAGGKGAEEMAPVWNEWNYVDQSMDVSRGIPEGVLGRLAHIRESGKLLVATDPHYPPQEFIDPSLSGQDQYVGSDIELAKRIAGRMGVELVIVPLDFADVLGETAEGMYDLAISGLAYTPGRAMAMTLSKGYHFSSMDASTGLLIREEDKGKIRNTEDLAEKTIVAQSSSLQEMQAAENIPLYREFRRVDSIQEIYELLEGGEADCGAVDVENAQIYIQQHRDCGLVLMDGVRYMLEPECEGDRVAAPQSEAELIAFVNGVIDEVLEENLYRKWFEEYTSYAERLGLYS